MSSLDPQDVQFGVLTPSIKEWTGMGMTDSCAGIIPIHENRAADFVLSLNAWAQANKSGQAVVLLLDGLDKVKNWNSDALDNLRWLLMRGPARRVWPIITLDPKRKDEVAKLMSYFRTKITAHGGNQFTMNEGNPAELNFWTPQS